MVSPPLVSVGTSVPTVRVNIQVGRTRDPFQASPGQLCFSWPVQRSSVSITHCVILRWTKGNKEICQSGVESKKKEKGKNRGGGPLIDRASADEKRQRTQGGEIPSLNPIAAPPASYWGKRRRRKEEIRPEEERGTTLPPPPRWHQGGRGSCSGPTGPFHIQSNHHPSTLLPILLSSPTAFHSLPLPFYSPTLIAFENLWA